MSHARTGAALGVGSLAMINIAAVITPKNLPMTATYGWEVVVVLAVAVLLFVLPLCLATAELASAWPQAGGVYAWVREAFGPRLGFLAVWCEWSENLAWLPTVLAFGAGTLAYVAAPDLAGEPVYLVVVMLTVLWGVTLLNLRPAHHSARFAAIGTAVGALLPIALIVVLAGVWLLRGDPGQLGSPTADHLIPDLSVTHVVFLSGIMLGFTGMELAGFFAREARDPGRTFPRALLVSGVVVVLVTLVGALAVATVLPAHDIRLVDGTMDFFETILDRLGLGWLLVPIVVLVLVGVLSHISPWILGPARGLAAVADEGHLPERLGRQNRHGVPAGGLIVQAIAASAFCLIFLAMGAERSYWMLTALTMQVFVVMYALMFLSVLRLRRLQPARPRPFAVPWPRLTMGLGLVGCAVAWILGFVPPDQLKGLGGDRVALYYTFMVVAFVALVAPPLVISRSRKATAIQISQAP